MKCHSSGVMSLAVCPGVFESREDNILISMHPLHLEQKKVLKLRRIFTSNWSTCPLAAVGGMQ